MGLTRRSSTFALCMMMKRSCGAALAIKHLKRPTVPKMAGDTLMIAAHLSCCSSLTAPGLRLTSVSFTGNIDVQDFF